MSTWRLAKSLTVLRNQVDQAWPARSRESDGTIGDQAHQGTTSDHNPDLLGVVRALDLTEDPVKEPDIGRLFESLRESRDSRIKYMIYDRHICAGFPGPNPWVWRAYSGSDPHTGHGHLSVVADIRADDTRPWTIGATNMQLTGPDPFSATGNGNEQAQQLRDGFYALLAGYQPVQAGPNGVIARLARIEQQLSPLPAAVSVIAAAIGSLDLDLSDEDIDRLAAAVVARPDNPLDADDEPIIIAAVKVALREGAGS